MGARSEVMVGRDAELAQLLEAFARAETGEAQVALVTGEAGIGKTRLVREFVARLPEGTVVAFGHAVPLSSGALPYGVVADLLRSLVREVHPKAVLDVLRERSTVLAPLVPRLGQAAAPIDRLALFAATQDLLTELTADGTLVLVLEDLHWADDASADLVHFWARTIITGRLLLVATSRDVGEEAVAVARASALARVPNADAITLQALDADAVLAQIEALGATADTGQIEEVVRLSEGLPLFVEELVGAGFEPPDSMHLDLAQRLPRLGEREVAIIQSAALASGSFTAELLSRVLGESQHTISAAIDVAEQAGLLERRSGHEWAFRHELLRLAVERTLTDEHRRTGHAAWARTFAERGRREDLTASAEHWAATGQFRHAFEARVRAGELLWDASGPTDVADQWLAALRIVHEHPGVATPDEHGDVLACVSLTAQWWEHLHEILRQETAALRSSELPHHHLMVLTQYMGSIWGDDVEATPPTREALLEMMEVWDRASPSRLAYITAYNLARAFWRQGLPDDLLRATELATRLADGIPDFQTRATSAAHTLRLMAMSTSSADERLRHVWEGVALAPSLDLLSRAELVVNAAAELGTQGELGAAWTQCQDALRLVPSPEASWIWVPIANNVVQVAFMLGEWDGVENVASQGATAPIGRANRNNLTWYASLVRAQRGMFDRWEPERSSIDDDGLAILMAVPSAMARRTRDPAAARAALEQALLVSRGHPDFGDWEVNDAGIAWSLAAELAWRDPSAPADYVAEISSRVRSMSGYGGLYDVWRAQARAHLERTNGEWAVDEWSRLISEWDARNARHQAAEARLRLAEGLLGQDAREAAAEALGTALATAESLGAVHLAAEIRTLASRARLRLPGHEPAQGDTGPLTAREHEVLQLLVQGMTNDQIGSTLFMSPRTASVHVSHIMQKLGAANRTEVAAVAHRRGLVTAVD